MVRFAPLVLPLRRRLQTLGVLFWAFPFIASVFVIAAFILLPWLWPFTFSYILFMLNDRAPTHGGRVSKFMRSLRVRPPGTDVAWAPTKPKPRRLGMPSESGGWGPGVALLCQLLSDGAEEGGRPVAGEDVHLWLPPAWYALPTEVRQRARAPADPAACVLVLRECRRGCGRIRTGIVGVGVWGNFATEGNNISKVFPGIQFRMGTLDTNFQIPVFRDYIMSLGFIRCACVSSAEGRPGPRGALTRVRAIMAIPARQRVQAVHPQLSAVRPGPRDGHCHRRRGRVAGRPAGHLRPDAARAEGLCQAGPDNRVGWRAVCVAWPTRRR